MSPLPIPLPGGTRSRSGLRFAFIGSHATVTSRGRAENVGSSCRASAVSCCSCADMLASLTDILSTASSNGNLAEVKRLLEKGADVNGLNKFNRTALQVAMTGHAAVIVELLLAGADPNLADPAVGLTVLHDASREGFEGSVRVLLNHGADANVVDASGNLPLHLAAREGHLEAIRLLIGYTANPEQRNNDGATFLQLVPPRRV